MRLGVLNNNSARCTFTIPSLILIQNDTKKRELLKNPTKIEEILEKKFIDRN